VRRDPFGTETSRAYLEDRDEAADRGLRHLLAEQGAQFATQPGLEPPRVLGSSLQRSRPDGVEAVPTRERLRQDKLGGRVQLSTVTRAESASPQVASEEKRPVSTLGRWKVRIVFSP
jgi:hypothetical protein